MADRFILRLLVSFILCNSMKCRQHCLSYGQLAALALWLHDPTTMGSNYLLSFPLLALIQTFPFLLNDMASLTWPSNYVHASLLVPLGFFVVRIFHYAFDASLTLACVFVRHYLLVVPSYPTWYFGLSFTISLPISKTN